MRKFDFGDMGSSAICRSPLMQLLLVLGSQKGFDSTEYLWLYNVKCKVILSTNLRSINLQVQIPVRDFF